MLKLRQLEYAIAIADCRSFARAAVQVNVSQPTLSQQIRALEDQLGVTLFERSTAGALLTPVGREVITRARAILRDARDLNQMTRRAGKTLGGTISLGTTPTLGPYLLSPVIAQLHQLLPELRIHVREGIPSALIDDLVSGSIDLYLGSLPGADALLEIQPLFREPMHLVLAQDHPLARERALAPERLRGMSLLSIDPRHQYHRQLATIAELYGMRLARDYEGTSLDSLHQMASSGLGATVLPALYLTSDVGGLSGLNVVDVAGWDHYRSIALAWRRSAATGGQFQMLGDHIAAAARQLMAGSAIAD